MKLEIQEPNGKWIDETIDFWRFTNEDKQKIAELKNNEEYQFGQDWYNSVRIKREPKNAPMIEMHEIPENCTDEY